MGQTGGPCTHLMEGPKDQDLSLLRSDGGEGRREREGLVQLTRCNSSACRTTTSQIHPCAWANWPPVALTRSALWRFREIVDHTPNAFIVRCRMLIRLVERKRAMGVVRSRVSFGQESPSTLQIGDGGECSQSPFPKDPARFFLPDELHGTSIPSATSRPNSSTPALCDACSFFCAVRLM